MAQVQQHDEGARDDRMGQPEHRCREAEQEIQRFGDGRQRRREGQRQQLGSGLFAVLPPGAEDERRRDAKVAEGLGEAGVHPDDALREGQAEGIVSHHDHIGPDVGDAVRRQLPAQ